MYFTYSKPWKFCYQYSHKLTSLLQFTLALGPLLLTGVNFNPSLISNYIHCKVCFEITYPYPNFNGAVPNFSGCTFEVWEWISNLFLHFIELVITCPCWDKSLTMLVKGAEDLILVLAGDLCWFLAINPFQIFSNMADPFSLEYLQEAVAFSLVIQELVKLYLTKYNIIFFWKSWN